MKFNPMMAVAAALLAGALGSRGDALTVQTILNTLTPQDYFDLANQPVSESEYVLASVLPDELRANYEAKTGSLKVITTPAGETGMDSPYVPVGGMELNAFSQPIAKWTATSLMTEQAQRELQQMVINIRAGVITGNGLDYVRTFVVNWLQKVIAQSFKDRHELMRGEVLTTGKLVLRGGTVDYGVPVLNFLAPRTGLDGYGAGNSKFWQDMRVADTRLRAVRGRMMSMNTLHAIIDNPSNNVAVVAETISQEGNIKIVQVRKTVNNGQNFSQDVREGYTLIGYARVVKLRLPGGGYADQQVLADGKIAVVGTSTVQLTALDGTIVSRPGLGRIHVGPTVEGDGRPGVWLNARTDPGRPYQAIAEGAANSLPVIDAPERLVVLTTDMP